MAFPGSLPQGDRIFICSKKVLNEYSALDVNDSRYFFIRMYHMVHKTSVHSCIST